MKKAVLLGDSIRQIGYGTRVPALLAPDIAVWQPEDNGRFASYTLRNCFDYKAELETADVIHWNNGLWDMCDLFGDGPFTPLPVYTDTLVRIAHILQSYCPRVIFATTTPPRPEMWGHDPERVKAYNAAAVAALRPLGVRIDDLYSLIAPDTQHLIRGDDFLHLTDEGIALTAGQVARSVREALAE